MRTAQRPQEWIEPLWERQPGEPLDWFDRFDRFRLMGAKRAPLTLFNQELNQAGQPKRSQLDGHWKKQVKRWRWIERAQAWDSHEREQRNADYERQKQEARQLRQTTIRALQAMLGRVMQAEQGGRYNVDALTFKHLAQGAAVVFRESRLEFGEVTEINANVEMSWEDVMRRQGDGF